MKGAAEYKNALKRGETIHGKLKIWFGSHARGNTLQIWVKDPEGEVLVYGIINGQPGWTEEYGWIHTGPWIGDFNQLIDQLIRENAAKNAKWEAAKLEEVSRISERQKQILSRY